MATGFRPWRRTIALTLLVMAMALLLWGLVQGRKSYVAYRDSEYALYGTMMACQLVEAYSRANAGRWPASWDDMKQVQVQEIGPFQWPRDIQLLKEYVQVDFSYDLADGRHGLDAERFDAIKPRKRCVAVYRDYAIGPLVEYLKTIEQQPKSK